VARLQGDCGSHGTAPQEDISGLLIAWSEGDKKALEELISVVYPEMRRIARQHLGRQASDHTLQSAALANEAYLKLVRAQGIQCEKRTQFFACAPRSSAAS
jgi:RNA polymerase sigma-70 factor (ECF subfamily)